MFSGSGGVRTAWAPRARASGTRSSLLTTAVTCAPAATAIHRSLEVEFLFLDLKLCERCQGTEKALEESVAEAAKILGPTGVDVTLKMTHVETEKDALRLAFVSSPTVRVNGRDVALEVKENACSGCSSLCGSEISCRVWTWQGREYSIPPKAMLLDAILKDAYVHASDGTEARAPIDQVPENLKRFFQGSNRGGP